MRQLTLAETVADFPAYKIVRRELNSGAYVDGMYRRVDFTDIVAGESLAIAGRGYFKEFQPGSVISYALKNGDDPLEAVETARARKHKLHWINSCSTCITSHARPQETWTLIEVGMLVRFEGKFFTLAKAPNDNLALVPYVFAD